jgi:hypothetical protein
LTVIKVRTTELAQKGVVFAGLTCRDATRSMMTALKIREIPDDTLRRKWLESQRDDGRPSEDDIVREHFGARGEIPDDPNKLPLEANTRTDWPVGSAK